MNDYLDSDDRPIWSHREHMAWGSKMFRNGIFTGFGLGVFVTSLMYLVLGKLLS